MKKIVIFSEESIFSGNTKCGVAEVVDSLAFTLTDNYEVNVVCKAGDLSFTKIITDLEEKDDYAFGRFQSINYFLIKKDWPNRGVELLNSLKPDIIHSFDFPELIEAVTYEDFTSIYTIDNINFVLDKQSFLKKYNYVTFPSVNYTKEILSNDKYRETLEGVNISYAPIGNADEIFDPQKGLLIPHKYSLDDFQGKQICKKILSERLGFSESAPVFLCMSRLVPEKGIDLIINSITEITKNGGVLLVVGKGECYEKQLQELANQKRLYYIGKEFSIFSAMSILAAADFFLSPSLFEPGGLMPMTASLYGAIPIVTQVGGLVDNFNDENAIICDLNSLNQSVQKAFCLYQSTNALEQKRKVCMKQKFGWTYRKQKFIDMYERGAIE